MHGASYGPGDPVIVGKCGSTVCYYLSRVHLVTLALSAANSFASNCAALINLHPHKIMSVAKAKWSITMM